MADRALCWPRLNRRTLMPANVLVYEFDTPRPGYYQINLACGDATKPVTNQQIQVFDGPTLIKTLFTGAFTLLADEYLDAQGNILTSTQWPLLNAGVVLIFQTTQVIFQIGDGIHSTYVSSLQVQDATQVESNGRRRLPHFRKTLLKRWFQPKKPVLPLLIIQPQKQLVLKKKPIFRRRKLRLIKRKILYPVVFAFSKPVRKTPIRPFKRKKLRLLRKHQYIPVVAKPALFVAVRPFPRPHIHRTWTQLQSRKYPNLGFISSGGFIRLGSKVITRIV